MKLDLIFKNKKKLMERNMEYKVKWIINGEITIKASSKEMAEDNVKNKLKLLVDNHQDDFAELGATAIQGSANIKT